MAGAVSDGDGEGRELMEKRTREMCGRNLADVVDLLQ